MVIQWLASEWQLSKTYDKAVAIYKICSKIGYDEDVTDDAVGEDTED